MISRRGKKDYSPLATDLGRQDQSTASHKVCRKQDISHGNTAKFSMAHQKHEKMNDRQISLEKNKVRVPLEIRAVYAKTLMVDEHLSMAPIDDHAKFIGVTPSNIKKGWDRIRTRGRVLAIKKGK